ncbi:hypothetical protein [Streptomyces sp. NPDC050287]|uniref:hypothetical protein n=1 Tax=Streptomyces sp. NPDC050287 TaxID=3365608 RepID=UPI00378BCB6B
MNTLRKYVTVLGRPTAAGPGLAHPARAAQRIQAAMSPRSAMSVTHNTLASAGTARPTASPSGRTRLTGLRGTASVQPTEQELKRLGKSGVDVHPLRQGHVHSGGEYALSDDPGDVTLH